ncbi:hypothetical protein FOZ61_005625 [Perkinsus olseni]|uniref:Uncharacterized protein n=1 Tax=Perkinsus olseni TaxID=32597 RepID=A0A7J6MCE2_PEROL|nr:hypothetical protein FOZ61_005625 [Perkinsus olseni]
MHPLTLEVSYVLTSDLQEVERKYGRRKRMKDLEELWSRSESEARGTSHSLLVFIDPTDWHREPKLLASVKSVESLNRLNRALEERVDALAAILNAARYGYYRELAYLRRCLDDAKIALQELSTKLGRSDPSYSPSSVSLKSSSDGVGETVADGAAVAVGSIKLPLSGWTVDEVLKRLENTEVYFYDILRVLEPPTRDLVKEAIARATERLLMMVSQLKAQIQEEGDTTPRTPEEIAASCLRALVSEHLVKWNVIVNQLLQLMPPGEIEALAERLAFRQQLEKVEEREPAPLAADREALANLGQEVVDLKQRLVEAASEIESRKEEIERERAQWAAERSALRDSLAESRSSGAVAKEQAAQELTTLRMGLKESQDQTASLRAQLEAIRKEQQQRQPMVVPDEAAIRAEALKEYTADLEEEKQALRREHEKRAQEMEEDFNATVRELELERDAMQRELDDYREQLREVASVVRMDEGVQSQSCGSSRRPSLVVPRQESAELRTCREEGGVVAAVADEGVAAASSTVIGPPVASRRPSLIPVQEFTREKEEELNMYRLRYGLECGEGATVGEVDALRNFVINHSGSIREALCDGSSKITRDALAGYLASCSKRDGSPDFLDYFSGRILSLISGGDGKGEATIEELLNYLHVAEESTKEEQQQQQPTAEEGRMSLLKSELRDGASQTEAVGGREGTWMVPRRSTTSTAERDRLEKMRHKLWESPLEITTAFRDRERAELVRPYKEEILILRKDNEERCLRMAALQHRLDAVRLQLAEFAKANEHHLNQQQKEAVTRLLSAGGGSPDQADDDDLRLVLDGINVPYRVRAQVSIHKSRRQMLYFDSKIRHAREAVRSTTSRTEQSVYVGGQEDSSAEEKDLLRSLMSQESTEDASLLSPFPSSFGSLWSVDEMESSSSEIHTQVLAWWSPLLMSVASTAADSPGSRERRRPPIVITQGRSGGASIGPTRPPLWMVPHDYPSILRAARRAAAVGGMMSNTSTTSFGGAAALRQRQRRSSPLNSTSPSGFTATVPPKSP